MSNRPQCTDGYAQVLAEFGQSLLKGGEQRLELFSLEVKEEKLRMTQLFILISAALIGLWLGLTFACATLVYLLWDTHPLATLVTLGLLSFAGGTLCFILGRRCWQNAPAPFSASLEELRSDQSCLSKNN